MFIVRETNFQMPAAFEADRYTAIQEIYRAQYAGRLHRIHDSKKEGVIYDYVDFDVPVLTRMYDRRTTGYRSIGYKIEDQQS